MPQETRSRITVLLPVPSIPAAFAILDEVITDIVGFCDGATVSQQQPPIFDGWWIPKPKSARQPSPPIPPRYDSIVLVQGDTAVSRDSPVLWEYLDRLKLRTQELLDQDIVWITVHDVTRVTTGDKTS